MTGKKFIMLAILLAGLLTLSAVSAAENITSGETDDIASIENQEILKENNDGTFTDLANEIGNATDELTLNRNYIYSDGDIEGLMPIDKRIVINGNGHTINGNGTGFTITSADVILNNIDFIKSSVYWYGENGKITNCRFTDPTNYNNNLIYWGSENGMMENCTIADIDNQQIYWDGENGKMTNCNFINCSSNNHGGAIYWNGNGGSLTDCNFINCSSNNYGGAIYWFGENGTIADCNFINTITNLAGGAIHWTGAKGTVTNCRFMNATSGFTGGAIYWDGKYGKIENNTFINTLDDYSGDAIYGTGPNSSITDNFIMKNTGNTDKAIYWEDDSSTLSDNTIASIDMNAIYYESPNCTIINNTIINSKAVINYESPYCTIINNTIKNTEVVLFLKCSNNIIKESDFDAINLNCENAEITNSNIKRIELQCENAEISNCNFKNSVESLGGAIHWEGGRGIITNCSFINTTARYNGDEYPMTRDLGGAIYCTNAKITITNSRFLNTTSIEKGGAIYCDNANLTVKNTIFINSTSELYAGAIYCDNANLTVKNTIFINSTSELYAGAIYCEANCTNLSNCTFINITSLNDYGAIYCEADSVNLSDCAFTSCTSIHGSDGAIHLYVRDNCTITNCNFTNTHSDMSAGAIRIKGSTNHPKANIKNCNFENTTAGVRGGAIVLFNATSEIDNCNFINSHIAQDYEGTFIYGGAIFMFCFEGSITNCNFINSAEAKRQASVIWWYSDYYQKSNGVIRNCTFINANSSKYYAREGGAIDWDIENALLENCNFINCTAENGGALYLKVRDNCTITDCNFKNCFAIEHGGPVYLNHGSLLNCNFIDCSAQCEDTNIYRTDGTKTDLYASTSITTTYNSDEKLVATLKVSEKYPLANAKVTFALWKGFETGPFDYKEICPNHTKTFTTDSNGQASYSLDGIAPGNYTATITFAGDETYAASGSLGLLGNTEITINKANTALTTKYDETGKYLIATLKDVNGRSVKGVKIGFVMPDGVKYAETDANGIAKYSVKGLSEGSYSVQVAFLGDNNYNPSNKQTVKFTINKGDTDKVATKLTVTNTATTYKSNKYIIATLTDAKGNPISGEKIGFANNGMTYINTDANGKARYYTKDLVPGTYNINAKFFGNEGYMESNKATSKVVINKAATTLTAKYNATGKNIVATVKDGDGNPVSGIKVGFAINGVKYVTTDANGQAKYSTKDLADNTYKVTIMAYGNDLYENSNKQSITFTVGDKQQSKIFLRNAQYFVLEEKYVKVTLWDANNNPLAGKTVHLTLDEYGLKYSGVTDANGDAYIRVGVGYGTHSATVSFDGDDQYTASTNKGNIRVIKATPSLIVRDADTHFKVENKNKNFRVYLQDRTGQQLYAEAKLVVKLNDMTYISNSYGSAVSTIDLDKVGIYNAEVIFGGNSAYNSVRKNVKIYVS